MKHMNYEQDKFLLYESGSYNGDVAFFDDKIMQRKRNMETGEWESWEEFDIGDSTYGAVFQDIKKYLSESQCIDWKHGSSVLFKSGVRYAKYMKAGSSSEDRQDEAWIWAMDGAGIPADILVCNNLIVGFILPYREHCNVLVRPGYERLTPAAMWQDSMISKDMYNVRHEGTYMVRMRDGVNLAAEVWLPSGMDKGDKVPSILIRTPYGRLSGPGYWFRFVRRGYALVIQDVRGRDDSEGEWIPYKYDMEDGDDTLNWIAGQEWSTGNIGMIGASYLGYVQWAAAASGNPNLKAVVSLVCAGPPFIDIKRKGGIYTSGAMAWTFMMAEQRMNNDALKRDDWKDVLNIRPIRDIPKRALGKNIHFWDEYMAHPDNDDFWKKTDWNRYGYRVDVPSIIISGWYDDNGMGSTAAWEMNEQNNRPNQKLIFGPWKHNFNTARELEGVNFGIGAVRYDLDLLCQKWFDRFLKGIENSVERILPVQYYMVGKNKWFDSEKWPPADAVYKCMYLHSGGNANTSRGGGSLNFVPPADENHDYYQFDPKDPAPFLIDVSENEMNVPGNYKDVDLRKDVLVFTSDALQGDMAIAGNIFAEIYASSSAKDTDWLVRLEDVDSTGNSIRLVDGIIRARYRKSFEKPELLEPGKIEKYEIRMAKIANLFKAGHRVRVTVTSGAGNLAFPNHNTGNNVPDDVEMVTALQAVYHDKDHPSCVKLPVIDKI